MKRIFAVIFSSLILLSVCSCTQNPENTQSSEEEKTVSISSESSQNAENISDSETKTADYETAVFGNDVLDINITVSEDKWNEFLKNAGSKPYVRCDIEINGETYKDVGIKTKGNTSLQQLVNDDTTTRYSLKVNFDKYNEGQTCHGLDKLALNNIYADSTYLKEYMSYDLMKYMNVPSSLCTFAEIKVNGEHFGFYLAVEDVDDSYIERNYGTDNSVKAYKPESMDMGDKQGNFDDIRKKINNGEMPDRNNGEFPEMPEGMTPPDMNNGEFPQMPENMTPPDRNNGEFPQMPDDFNKQGMGKGGMDGGRNGVDLKYIDDNTESYSSIFDNSLNKTTEEDEKRLVESLKNISEGKELEKYINTDEVLRYLACNVFLVNLDSYLSSNCHNYILAEDNGQLSMLPWDYNLSFGSFQSETAESAVNYAVDTIFNGVSAEDRPLIAKLLESEENIEKYHSYLKEIAEKYVQSGIFEQTVNRLTDIIDGYVKNDTTSFDGYDAYKEGVETLKKFTSLRAESVLGQLDGSIPSTSEEQQNSDKLIDTSDLDMKKLGSMNMGGGKGDFPKKFDRKNTDE